MPVSTTSSAAESVMSASMPSRAVSDEYSPISSASCSAYSAQPSPMPGDQKTLAIPGIESPRSIAIVPWR